MYYRGFIRTDGKRATEKFKDKPGNELRTIEEAKCLDSFAGVLADDITLVDFDDEMSGSIALEMVRYSGTKCRIYKSTRGYHFLFKSIEEFDSCKTHTVLACGLMADIKVGSKNSYECLRKDKIDREIIEDADIPDRLPYYFVPVKNGISFLEIEEGQRNDSLFRHKCILSRAGFHKDTVKEIIRLINEKILIEPLPDKEINTILRDDGFEYIPDPNKKPTVKQMARELIDQCHFLMIDGDLYVYCENHYSNRLEDIEGVIFDRYDLGSNRRKEVYKAIRLLLRNQKTELSDSKLIPFNNGILDLNNDEMLDHSPMYRITRIFKHNYNPEAYSEVMDKTLDRLCCNDKDLRKLLEEAVGYIFLGRNELGKAFVLIGEKSNGKSTFLKILKVMIGIENITTLDIAQMMGKFEVAQLAGKIANLGDDIGDEFIANPSIFKSLVTGEGVNVQRKGQDPFDMYNTAKFFFTANNVPRIKDRSGAVQRRLSIIPFNAQFSSGGKDYKYNIIDDLTTENSIEYLIRIGIEGLKRVLARKAFTVPDCVKKEMDKYRVDSNSITGFIADCKENDNPIEDVSTQFIYEDYRLFCNQNNHKAFGKNTFVNQICKELNLVKTRQRDKSSGNLIYVLKKEEKNNAS